MIKNQRLKTKWWVVAGVTSMPLAVVVLVIELTGADPIQ
jgi:H+/Cl- antiporter ClcA